MLWTDADFVTIADLLSVEPEIDETAEALHITLDGENGTIRRGLEQAGSDVENMFTSFASYVAGSEISSQHLSAFHYTGNTINNRRRHTLEQIVVSGRNENVWSDVKRWAVNQVLMTFYLSATSRSEKDRYETKLEIYQKRDLLKLWPSLKQSGFPLVYRPMACPGAVMQRDPGTWAATAAVLSGGAADVLDVAITYVDESLYASPTQTGNAESNPSARKTVTLTADQGLVVNITGLTPPNGAIDPTSIGRAFVVPRNATGWNIYVGQTGETLYLQNASPIPIATKTYTFADDPTTTGARAQTGQWAELFVTVQDTVNRG